MLKKFLAVALALAAASAFAAIDVNKATAAELDGINGVGPGLSNRILEERRKAGNFKDWADLIGRVSGIQESRAATLSAEGLTVNGVAFKPAKPAAQTAQAAVPAASAASAAAASGKQAKAGKPARKKQAPKKTARPTDTEAGTATKADRN